MKINVNRKELEALETLLPPSATALIHVLGYDATARLVTNFGGVTLTAVGGEAAERTGGAYSMMYDVMTEEEVAKLKKYVGPVAFYIPRCEAALRKLRNARFVAAVAERQEMGLSIRQALAVLCPQFGISDRLAWELLQSHRDSGQHPQNELF